MPIYSQGEEYDELSYTAKLLGIELPKEAPGEAQSSEGTPVPPVENNAPAGQNSGRRGIVDNLLGQTGERYQTWPEKVVRGGVEGAIKAFSLPGDVYSGKVAPGSPQEIERALDLAGLMVFGPAPVASRMAEGTLGSFAGVTSRSLDKTKLMEAQSMLEKNVHPDEIWEKTGFFKGADNRWRYEIPDSSAKLSDKGFEKYIDESPSGELQTYVSVKKEGTTLGEALDHPELYKAYPQLRNMKILPLPKQIADRGVLGQMSGDTMYLQDGLDPDFAKSVILHELQHDIQHIEKFARGGSPLEFKSPQLKAAEDQFTAVRAETEKELMQTYGWTKSEIAEYKSIISREDTQKGFNLNAWKERHPEAYDRLKNIVASEKLLHEQAVKQHTLYTRLMGEVESRNVQTRIDFDELQRFANTPRSTEDIPRFLQIYRTP